MNQESHKSELYELWDKFWLADEEEAIRLGEFLQQFIANVPNQDAEDYYLWGLSIYSLNQNDVLEKCHPLFLSALEQDHLYYLARLYSAHCYHDKALYKQALEEYLLVDQVLLEKEMPIWRTIKLNEQIGFCYAKLGQQDLAEKYFLKIISAYLEIEKDELVPIQEAYECLPPEHPLVQKLKQAEDEHFA